MSCVVSGEMVLYWYLGFLINMGKIDGFFFLVVFVEEENNISCYWIFRLFIFISW